MKYNENFLLKHKACEKILDRFTIRFTNIDKYFDLFSKNVFIESSNIIQSHLLPFINNLSQIEKEITILCSLMKLPIYEINNQTVLNSLSRYAIGSLNCSIMCCLIETIYNANSTHFLKTKDKLILEVKTSNDIDTLLSETSEKGLQVCNNIIEMYNGNVSNSTYSNICTLVTFNLIKGISCMFTLHGVSNLSELQDDDHIIKSLVQRLQNGLVFNCLNQVL